MRSALLLTAVCAPAILPGCGPSTAPVSGFVAYGGHAPQFKGLQITFIAADGRMASAPVGEDGSFTADAAPVGKVGVAFVYTPPDDVQRAKSGSKLPQPGAGAPNIGPRAAAAPNPIPVRLRDASTSQLTFQVDPGKKNTFNYNIEP
jgi:hypothetical protein